MFSGSHTSQIVGHQNPTLANLSERRGERKEAMARVSFRGESNLIKGQHSVICLQNGSTHTFNNGNGINTHTLLSLQSMAHSTL